MVYLTPYLFGISTMELPTSKFENFAYTWHWLCEPPKRNFTSATIQWLLFLFHSFQIFIFLKKISATISSSIIPICIKVCIPLSRNIDSNKFLNNEYDISLPPINVPTPISVQLPPPALTTPVPSPKLSMTPEEEQSFISNLLNYPSTFPPKVTIKETIGKLGLLWPRKYALERPAIPILFYYAQNGLPVDCGKD